MKKLGVGLVVLSLNVLPACGTAPTESAVKITNGKIVPEANYPGVVNLYRRVKQNGQVKGGSTCTGTWVAENTILTAAHCTGDGPSDADGKVMDLEMVVFDITDHNSKPKATRTVTRIVSAYRLKQWEAAKGFNRYDLAILKTEDIKPTERARAIIALSPVAAVKGDTIEIIGYGYNNMSTFNKSGDDLLRVGSNVIQADKNGFLNIQGQTKDANGGATGEAVSAGQGDSGGPMLLNGQVVGVASGGGLGGLFARGESSYVNLYSAESQAFLRSMGL